MSKKDEVVWMPYEEYILHEHLMGRVSKEEYEVHMQYIKENKGKNKTFKEWLSEKEKA